MPVSREKLRNIRPITDLRTQIGEILEQTSETSEPVILTKNGTASGVIMSVKAFEANEQHWRIIPKLRETEVLYPYESNILDDSRVFDEVKGFIAELGIERSIIESVPTPRYEPGTLEVWLLDRAVEDTECIATYLISEIESPTRAQEFMIALHDAFKQIAKAPKSGCLFQDVALDRTYRYISLKDALIFYTFDDGISKVWRIIHPSQDVDRRYSIEDF